MQHAAVILEQADAALQEERVQGPRRILLHRMIGQALQQQDDFHAARRRLHQRLAKTPPREEIGIGNHHFIARAPDRIEVGVLDVVTVAKIVADQKCRAKIAATSTRAGASTGTLTRRRKLAHASMRHRRCAESTIGPSSGPSTRTA